MVVYNIILDNYSINILALMKDAADNGIILFHTPEGVFDVSKYIPEKIGIINQSALYLYQNSGCIGKNIPDIPPAIINFCISKGGVLGSIFKFYDFNHAIKPFVALGCFGPTVYYNTANIFDPTILYITANYVGQMPIDDFVLGYESLMSNIANNRKNPNCGQYAHILINYHDMFLLLASRNINVDSHLLSGDGNNIIYLLHLRYKVFKAAEYYLGAFIKMVTYEYNHTPLGRKRLKKHIEIYKTAFKNLLYNLAIINNRIKYFKQIQEKRTIGIKIYEGLSILGRTIKAIIYRYLTRQ